MIPLLHGFASHANFRGGLGMTKIRSLLTGAATVALVVMGGRAMTAQDKYTLQAPNGLAFSDFRGFESWQAISVSHAEETIEVILGNPAMIDAFLAGIPGNGKPFPDGAKMAKIHWNAKKSEDAPSPTTVPGTLHDIDFMEKDSKRFSDTHGWGYSQFNYDSASDTFKPEGEGANCGAACHELAAGKDYVFTVYGKR
jgi:Cytochrome P460